MSAIFQEPSSSSFSPEFAPRGSLVASTTNIYLSQAEAIDNLRDLFQLYDGSSEYQFEPLFRAHCKVFDVSVVALTHASNATLDDLVNRTNRVELDFHGMYEMFASYAKKRTALELTRVEPKDSGVFDYYVQLNHLSHLTELHLRAQTRNGKIVRVERLKTKFVAMENLQNLIALFDGRPYDQETFRAAFETALDQQATGLFYPLPAATTEVCHNIDPTSRVERDFEEMYKLQVEAYAVHQKPAKLVSMQPLPKGVLEYTTQGEYAGGRVATIHSRDETTLEGKIARVERGAMTVDYLMVS